MISKYDHDAIYKAYPNVIKIIGDVPEGIQAADGKQVTIEQSKVDAARAELDKLKYIDERRLAYPSWRTQLEYIYDYGLDKWKTDIVDPVKAKYPKP